MNALFERICRPFFNLEDYYFEKRYGVDFGEIIHSHKISTPHLTSLKHATAYDPIWCRNLRNIFNEILKRQSNFDNFIDIGCGKGKPCFYASLKHPFKKIIGIDLSPELICEAQKNLNSGNALFECIDAQFFKIPDGNSIIFMFNPFDKIMFEKFISLNVGHFRRYKSFIAYAQDNYRDALIKRGFSCVYRNASQALSIYQIQ